MRELLHHFSGQEVDGVLLGLPDLVQLPTFQQVASYRSDDGQIEADALADVADEDRWAVEIKWRGGGQG